MLFRSPERQEPTPDAVKAARTDTRVSDAIVQERIKALIGPQQAVLDPLTGQPGSYTAGFQGRAWGDLPDGILLAHGPRVTVTAADIQRLWREALRESSAGARALVAQAKVRPHFDGDMLTKSMSRPVRDLLWYELSAEAHRDRLPADLTVGEWNQFVGLIGGTSMRTEPKVNLERGLAAFSQALRGDPIDIDIVAPSTVRRALEEGAVRGQSAAGLKIGPFATTHSLVIGLPVREFPRSTNDTWVATM